MGSCELNVALGERSYPIWIGSTLLEKSPDWQRVIPGRHVLIVTDETVASLYLAQVVSSLQNLTIEKLILPVGEVYKTLDFVEQIWAALANYKFHRDSCVIALGGGVIGDLAGFAAACYMRGIAFLSMPTTLLAQVDSSVGGKTGVNLPQGKNLVGAFHQPVGVVIDIDTLATLPARQFHAGCAEIVKYATIQDPEFFAWLEHHADKILAKDPDSLIEAIARSCRHKAEIVARDEREQGERALLNFGHTFGHALETASEYSLLHGEAVAIGMVLAARLSTRLGLATESERQRLATLLKRFNLPVDLPDDIVPAGLLDLMQRDKKNREGRLRLILWREIGKAEVVNEISSNVILRFLQS